MEHLVRRAVTGVLVLAFIVASIVRTDVWRDPVTLWREGIVRSPGKIRPYLNLASGLITEMKLEEAEAVLFETTRVFRDVILSGNVYYLGAALEIYLNFASIYGSRGDIARAIEFIAKGLETDPDSAKAHYAMGYALMEKNDLEAARSYLEKALGIEESAKARFLLGDLHDRQGRFPDALPQVARAVTLEPENALYRNRLGIVLRELGRREEAEEEWRSAAHLNQNFAEPYVNLGSLAYEQGKLREAHQLYLKAIAIDPALYEARVGAGNTLDSLGLGALAIEQYEEAIQADPQRPEAYVDLGIVLERLGRKEEALKAYRNAARIDPRNGALQGRIRKLGG